MCPSGVFVVGGVVFEASVKDADESVPEGPECLVVAVALDRYFKRAYNCTVVEYLGRGHDHFYDEILRVFDWMGRFRRDFFPREFECETLRQWDNYFWWVEVDGLRANLRPGHGLGPDPLDQQIVANDGNERRVPFRHRKAKHHGIPPSIRDARRSPYRPVGRRT